MPFPGPWLTPPAQSIDVTEPINIPTDYSIHSPVVSATFTDTFADVCEAPDPGASTIHDDRYRAYIHVDISTFGILYWILHRPYLFRTVDLVVGNVTQYVPPALPPGAVGIEYEQPSPTVAERGGWITASTVSWDVWANDGAVTANPRPLTAQLRTSAGITGSAFLSGADFGALPLLWSHLIAGTANQHFTVAPMSIDIAGMAAAGVSLLWLGHEEQVTHDESGLLPYPGPPVTVGGEVALQDVSAAGAPVLQLHFEWTPGRYRYLYADRPPLAHLQRRDGTATAGPQLAHIGATGGRPPLAHRQHTP